MSNQENQMKYRETFDDTNDVPLEINFRYQSNPFLFLTKNDRYIISFSYQLRLFIDIAFAG